MLQQTERPIARIGTMNSIAKAGLSSFGINYLVGKADGDCEAIILRSAELDTAAYPALYAVGRAGSGVNNITVDKATEAGICVFNAPGANARSVAEIVMTMIGSNARRVVAAFNFCRSLAPYDLERTEAMVEDHKQEFVGYELASKTLGVIGLGQVGVQVANLAVQAGMNVIGYDPYLALPNALKLTNDPKLTIARSLEQVLQNSDIITVHVPLSDRTKSLIGAAQIAHMREGVVIVNYARAGICDDRAILSALDEKRVSTYISDFPSPDLIHPNIITTPHIGASTPESEDRCAVIVCQQIKDFVEYGTVMNSVNFPTVEVPLHPETRMRIAIVNRDITGMIASYTRVLAEAGLNIPSVAGDSNGKLGYFLIDVPIEVPAIVLDAIKAIDGVIRVRTIPINH